MKNLKNLIHVFICCFFLASIISCDTEDDATITEENSQLESDVLVSKTIDYNQLIEFADVKSKFDLIVANPDEYLQGLEINEAKEISYLKTISGLELIQVPLKDKVGVSSEVYLTFKIESNYTWTFLTDNSDDLSSTSMINFTQLKKGPVEPCVPEFYTRTICEIRWARPDGSNCQGYDDNNVWQGMDDECLARRFCNSYTDIGCAAF
jgi:hypothetical protein